MWFIYTHASVYIPGDELWQHMREEKHGCYSYMYKPQLCHLCGKSLKTLMSFKEHKLACEASQDSARKFTCEHCGAQFKTKSNYQNHKRNVHIEHPMTCHICGQTCKNARSLQEHRRRHDDANRKYGCKDCGKMFFSKNLLKMHVRTHTKEKPFKCAFCTYGCAVKQNLSKHARKRHKHLSEKECKDYSIIMRPLEFDSARVNVHTALQDSANINTSTQNEQNILISVNTENQIEDHPLNADQFQAKCDKYYADAGPKVTICENAIDVVASTVSETLNPSGIYPVQYQYQPHTEPYLSPQAAILQVHALPSQHVTVNLQELPNVWERDKDSSLNSRPSDKTTGPQEQSVEPQIQTQDLRLKDVGSQGNTELDLRVNREFYSESQYNPHPPAPEPTSGHTLTDLS